MQPSSSAAQQHFPVVCSSKITENLRQLAGLAKAIILQEYASHFQVDFLFTKKQSRIVLLLTQNAAVVTQKLILSYCKRGTLHHQQLRILNQAEARKDIKGLLEEGC